jgi:hypothetical protein
MKGALFLFLGFISMSDDTVPLAHVNNSFRLVVPAPLIRAATLFGPDGERCWAGPHWNPNFLYPQPGKDMQGAVFTVQHGPHNSLWINTLFDPAGGRMQYVMFIPDKLVSTVDVRLTSIDPSRTGVEVVYARTALDAAANDDVEAMGKRDRESGPEWQQGIENCLRGQR